MPANNQNLIHAEPTKDFFISMLIRDITVNAAIIDLVDNCIDGAIRFRTEERNPQQKGAAGRKSTDLKFDGLWIKLDTRDHQFLIQDNCGGISADLARNYAFKFGRPPEAELQSPPHSVGQFGVGMKRALFKLGSKFTIDSSSAEHEFEVKIDALKWRDETGEWHFKFGKLDEKPIPPERRGTKIIIEDLHPSVEKYFSTPENINKLRLEIGERHQVNIARGIAIHLNGREVRAQPAELLSSEEIRPGYQRKSFRRSGGGTVTVRIWAGLGRAPNEPENKKLAGWYVFCNGRMILRADQSSTTGWGEGDDTKVPKYHGEYRLFRGYAMFDSDDGNVLPWNTTKTGIDEESWIYPNVKQQMIILMKPVITFLNHLKKEADPERGEGDVAGPLAMAIEKAELSPVFDVPHSSKFVAPPAPPAPPRGEIIRYRRPKDDIERVKQALDAKSNREVGERTFDHYLNVECAE